VRANQYRRSEYQGVKNSNRLNSEQTSIKDTREQGKEWKTEGRFFLRGRRQGGEGDRREGHLEGRRRKPSMQYEKWRGKKKTGKKKPLRSEGRKKKKEGGGNGDHTMHSGKEEERNTAVCFLLLRLEKKELISKRLRKYRRYLKQGRRTGRG